MIPGHKKYTCKQYESHISSGLKFMAKPKVKVLQMCVKHQGHVHKVKNYHNMWKVLSQRINMCNMKAPSVLVWKFWPRLKVKAFVHAHTPTGTLTQGLAYDISSLEICPGLLKINLHVHNVCDFCLISLFPYLYISFNMFNSILFLSQLLYCEYVGKCIILYLIYQLWPLSGLTCFRSQVLYRYHSKSAHNRCLTLLLCLSKAIPLGDTFLAVY